MSYHYRISLRINHPSIIDSEITRIIGINPTNSWTFGKDRTTPLGGILSGKNKDSFWTSVITSGECPEQTVESDLLDIFSRLNRHSDFFREIVNCGGWVELFIGLFTMSTCLLSLNQDVLSSAGKLGIALVLDIYPPTQPQVQYPRKSNTLPV